MTKQAYEKLVKKLEANLDKDFAKEALREASYRYWSHVRARVNKFLEEEGCLYADNRLGHTSSMDSTVKEGSK